ncbi:hypothetical protein A4G20_00365 [Pasteurellaceae bacterium RH1A]|nr:hypothetical protein A4G20_00365 [Pasteurellaceae bacterium RH1A]
MKYAFIDYENLNSLDGLALNQYDRIFLFIGAGENQTTIRLSEKFNDEINITVVTVKEVAKNNVDFHIAYYLGKLDTSIDKKIEFHILSNDQGYDGLCRFILRQKDSRVCLRKSIALKTENKAQPKPEKVAPNKIDINKVVQEYKAALAKKQKKNRPAKTSSLKNDIINQTSLKGVDKKEAEANLQKVLQKLGQDKVLKITETKVTYF